MYFACRITNTIKVIKLKWDFANNIIWNTVAVSDITEISISQSSFTDNYSLPHIICKNNILHCVFTFNNSAISSYRQVFYRKSDDLTSGYAWTSPVEYISDDSFIKTNDCFITNVIQPNIAIDDNDNLHVVFHIINNFNRLIYTWKNISDLEIVWKNNLNKNITNYIQNFTKPNECFDSFPILNYKNGYLYILCMGSIWNNIYCKNPQPKMYIKNLGEYNPRFYMNKNGICDLSIFNNIQTPNHFNMIPSMFIDDDDIIHIGANIRYSTLYSKPYYFRSVKEKITQSGKLVTAITKDEGKIDTLNWKQITQVIIDENDTGQEIYYAVSFETNTNKNWYILTSNNTRKIVDYNKTTTTFKINVSDKFYSEDLQNVNYSPLPSNENEKIIKVLEEAVDRQILNRMSSWMLSNSKSFPLINMNSLKIAMMIRNNSPYNNPEIKSINIKYDAGVEYVRSTHKYEIIIRSLSEIWILRINDGETKNGNIFISDGSSTGDYLPTNINCYFAIQQEITQTSNNIYSLLNTNNLYNKKIENETFSLNGNYVNINSTGDFMIKFLFSVKANDLYGNSPPIINVNFSHDQNKTNLIKTLNVDGSKENLEYKTTISISTLPFNFGLYFKTNGVVSLTFSKINLFINRI